MVRLSAAVRKCIILRMPHLICSETPAPSELRPISQVYQADRLYEHSLIQFVEEMSGKLPDHFGTNYHAARHDYGDAVVIYLLVVVSVCFLLGVPGPGFKEVSPVKS